jgi:Fe-S cluster assembly ATP-binding protein
MLNIKNLSITVKNKQILKNINLQIKAGEIAVLMGPNGSGKSTLAQVLAGNPQYKLETRKSKVETNGLNLLDKTADQRVKLGLFVTWQSPPTIEGVKVFDLLRAIDYERNNKQSSFVDFNSQIKKMAKKLGLKSSILNRNLDSKLSGGERKRLEILQLLLISPKFAIIDEIDSGLDIDGVKMVAKVLQAKVKKGMGILLITHNQKILDYLNPNKYYILKSGKIVSSGGEQVLENLEKNGFGKI